MTANFNNQYRGMFSICKIVQALKKKLRIFQNFSIGAKHYVWQLVKDSYSKRIIMVKTKGM